MSDSRVAYGVSCTWWDSVTKAGTTATHPAHSASKGRVLLLPAGRKIKMDDHHLPCCPHCGSLLYEVASEQEWWHTIATHEAAGHPGYRLFIEWQRGKCFKTFDLARYMYSVDTGRVAK